MDNNDNIWAKQYIDHDQIDQKLVNKLSFDKFEFDIDDKYHQSATVHYTITEILGQFFSATMK